MPRAVGQPHAVRRKRRPERRAVTRTHQRPRASFAVVHAYLVLRKDRVIAPRAVALGVPHIPIVGPERRPQHAPAARPRGHVYSRSTAHVIEPEFFESLERCLTRYDDVVAVGCPLRRPKSAPYALRDRPDVAAIGGHEPHVIVTAAVGDEHDLSAVRAEPRGHVVGDPVGEPGGRSSPDGDGVEVTKQVENDGLPVGAHIQRNPGAFGCGEASPSSGFQWKPVPNPVFLAKQGLVGNGSDEQSECGDERAAAEFQTHCITPIQVETIHRNTLRAGQMIRGLGRYPNITAAETASGLQLVCARGSEGRRDGGTATDNH